MSWCMLNSMKVGFLYNVLKFYFVHFKYQLFVLDLFGLACDQEISPVD